MDSDCIFNLQNNLSSSYNVFPVLYHAEKCKAHLPLITPLLLPDNLVEYRVLFLLTKNIDLSLNCNRIEYSRETNIDLRSCLVITRIKLLK